MHGSTDQPVVGRLRGKVIVSCQAAEGEPLAHLDSLVRMAQSVLNGGAAGLRAEGAERVAAFRQLTAVPILGLTKSLDASGSVYITRSFDDAGCLSEAGADVIALDCTNRRLSEAEPWPVLLRRIHAELQRPVCADIATLDDALAAQDAGADLIATTLRGYTAETRHIQSVDWAFVGELVRTIETPVILEGHVQKPADVTRALALGVHAVVVGSAITRPQVITATFVAATRPI